MDYGDQDYGLRRPRERYADEAWPGSDPAADRHGGTWPAASDAGTFDPVSEGQHWRDGGDPWAEPDGQRRRAELAPWQVGTEPPPARSPTEPAPWQATEPLPWQSPAEPAPWQASTEPPPWRSPGPPPPWRSATEAAAWRSTTETWRTTTETWRTTAWRESGESESWQASGDRAAGPPAPDFAPGRRELTSSAWPQQREGDRPGTGRYIEGTAWSDGSAQPTPGPDPRQAAAPGWTAQRRPAGRRHAAEESAEPGPTTSTGTWAGQVDPGGWIGYTDPAYGSGAPDEPTPRRHRYAGADDPANRWTPPAPAPAPARPALEAAPARPDPVADGWRPGVDPGYPASRPRPTEAAGDPWAPTDDPARRRTGESGSWSTGAYSAGTVPAPRSGASTDTFGGQPSQPGYPGPADYPDRAAPWETPGRAAVPPAAPRRHAADRTDAGRGTGDDTASWRRSERADDRRDPDATQSWRDPEAARGSGRGPDTTQPWRDPDTARNGRAADTAQPWRDPDTTQTWRDPDTTGNGRGPGAALPWRDPDTGQARRDPDATQTRRGPDAARDRRGPDAARDRRRPEDDTATWRTRVGDHYADEGRRPGPVGESGRRSREAADSGRDPDATQVWRRDEDTWRADDGYADDRRGPGGTDPTRRPEGGRGGDGGAPRPRGPKGGDDRWATAGDATDSRARSAGTDRRRDPDATQTRRRSEETVDRWRDPDATQTWRRPDDDTWRARADDGRRRGLDGSTRWSNGSAGGPATPRRRPAGPSAGSRHDFPVHRPAMDSGFAEGPPPDGRGGIGPSPISPMPAEASPWNPVSAQPMSGPPVPRAPDDRRGGGRGSGPVSGGPAAAVPDNRDPRWGTPRPPVSGLPTSGYPMSGVPMSGIPMSGIPMSGIPISGVPLSGVPMSGIPGSGVPMSGVPMSGMPMSGVPMSGVPMSGMPMSGVPMSGMPMSGVPMSGMPMSGMPMSGMPMSGVPMSGVPVSGGADGRTRRRAADEPRSAPPATARARVRPAGGREAFGQGQRQQLLVPADQDDRPSFTTRRSAAATDDYARRAGREMRATAARQRPSAVAYDELYDEPQGGPLAAVGYTAGWYGVPVLLCVIYMLFLDPAQRANALGTLAGATPQFLLSMLFSMVVAVFLRWASGTWRSVSVGLAAAVMGGGLATVLMSAVTGQQLG